MNFNLLTDENIIKELGQNYEELRLRKKLSDEDVMKKGGSTKDAIQRLKNGSNINLINFIKILRGLGELDSLEKVIKVEDSFSIRENKNKPLPRRVFKRKKSDNSTDFKWGDDE